MVTMSIGWPEIGKMVALYTIGWPEIGKTVALYTERGEPE